MFLYGIQKRKSHPDDGSLSVVPLTLAQNNALLLF